MLPQKKRPPRWLCFLTSLRLAAVGRRPYSTAGDPVGGGVLTTPVGNARARKMPVNECFRCGQPGHLSAACPSRTRDQLAPPALGAPPRADAPQPPPYRAPISRPDDSVALAGASYARELLGIRPEDQAERKRALAAEQVSESRRERLAHLD